MKKILLSKHLSVVLCNLLLGTKEFVDVEIIYSEGLAIEKPVNFKYNESQEYEIALSELEDVLEKQYAGVEFTVNVKLKCPYFR